MIFPEETCSWDEEPTCSLASKSCGRGRPGPRPEAVLPKHTLVGVLKKALIHPGEKSPAEEGSTDRQSPPRVSSLRRGEPPAPLMLFHCLYFPHGKWHMLPR